MPVTVNTITPEPDHPDYGMHYYSVHRFKGGIWSLVDLYTTNGNIYDVFDEFYRNLQGANGFKKYDETPTIAPNQQLIRLESLDHLTGPTVYYVVDIKEVEPPDPTEIKEAFNQLKLKMNELVSRSRGADKLINLTWDTEDECIDSMHELEAKLHSFL